MTHNTQPAHLHHRRHCSLLRSKHARRRPAHSHDRAKQRHAHIRAGPRRSGGTALSRDDRLLAGVATVEAHVTCEPVAATAGRPGVPASEALTTTAPSAISRQATTSHHPHQHDHR
jgi:hypothetical protein